MTGQRELHFDGPDFEPEKDRARLTDQHNTIKRLMLDGRWRSLAHIASVTEYPEASISAQLRHLRKKRFGAFEVDRRRDGNRWVYRVRRPPESGTA